MVQADNHCVDCYYNSANDFFDPGVDMSGKIIDVCYYDMLGYPHARMCAKYENVSKDMETPK